MAFKFTSRMSDFVANVERASDVTVAQAATEIDRNAKLLAPQLTGALKKSGTIVRNGNADYSVVFGNNQVHYARKREFENRKNPQTVHYLQRSGDTVAKDLVRFLRNLP